MGEHSLTLAAHLRLSLCSRSHQEDYYAFASLLLDPEGLQAGLKRTLGIDWTPKNISDPLTRQVVFVGLYDGYVSHPS